MKITHYYREKRAGNFSIEELFKSICSAFPGELSITSYHCSAYRSKLKEIVKARKYQGDVNHITGDINFLAFGLAPHKTVITIHDIGHYESTLKGIKKYIYKYLWLKFPLQRARYITTISEFTKSSILKHFKIDPDKIRVIYNPYPSFFKFQEKQFNKDKPTILQIGSGHNKNLKSLIEAVKGIQCRLILINRLNSEMLQALSEAGIEYEAHFELTYEEVYQKYLSADLVYFASTYEGFGMPIVEANAVGRPVITGNITSMPEIAGKAACIVNPYDILDIRKGILKIINDESYRDELIRNGRENIKRFEPGTIASQYAKVYRELVENK